MTDRKQPDRIAYPRLLAPVYFTRARLPRGLFDKGLPPGNSLGGVRVFTDERPGEGAPLHLEIFLADGTSVTCGVVVAWIDPLPEGAPARFEVGLEFTTLRPGDRERLAPVLEDRSSRSH
jgi:PilZ domain